MTIKSNFIPNIPNSPRNYIDSNHEEMSQVQNDHMVTGPPKSHSNHEEMSLGPCHVCFDRQLRVGCARRSNSMSQEASACVSVAERGEEIEVALELFLREPALPIRSSFKEVNHQ